MAINYDEAIAELRAEESRLQEELKQIQAAIPGLIILRNRARMQQAEVAKSNPQLTLTGVGKFARMGPTEAIPHVMRGREPMTTREIFDRLIREGWSTSAQKPIGVISATMISLEDKGIAERVGEAWRLKAPTPPSWNPSEHEQPLQQ